MTQSTKQIHKMIFDKITFRWITLLLIYVFSTRLLLVWPNKFSFGFDHGKDMMAIMHMVETQSLKFIGPWTSIPGLFFGPGWYYLIAPFYFVGQGNPLYPVISMIFLYVLFSYLIYRNFGWMAAIISASSPAWIFVSTSAWNPHPMPILMLLIIIGLIKIKTTKIKTYHWIILIGLSASLSFHFSSAYAAFYLFTIPLIIALGITQRKIILKIRHWLVLVASFLLPWIPQFLFELKNNFIQTKSVMNYLNNPPINQTKTPLSEIIRVLVYELRLIAAPEIIHLPDVNRIILFSYLILACCGLLIRIKNRHKPPLLIESIILIFIPLIGFSYLHFNIWYLLAIYPLILIQVSWLLTALPVKIQVIIAIMLLVTPFSHIYFQLNNNRIIIDSLASHLPVKQQVIRYVYDKAAGKPFSVYTYMPDIYDYPYQYLFFIEAKNGRTLPVEFSYQPGEISYIPEKSDLLSKFDQYHQDPELIFYIVHNPEDQGFLNSWWNHQLKHKIIYQQSFGKEITLYTALPYN